MRFPAALLATITMTVSLLLTPGCKKPVEPEPAPSTTRFNEFSTRLEAARLMTDIAKRDEALTSLIREAAVSGRIDAVKQGIADVSSQALRDKVAGEAALKLASVSSGEGALVVAKLIVDAKLRDEVLAKIVKGPTRE